MKSSDRLPAIKKSLAARKMNDRVLIYDDHCPLCCWYSSLFTRFGWLPPDGRKPFSTLEPELMRRIDPDRAGNEIPLLDRSTGEVWYGSQALLAILGERFHWIEVWARIGPIKWMLERSYRLISYNRKVIVAKKCSPGAIDCVPDLHYSYRILFMLLCLAFNTLALFPLEPVLASRFRGQGISGLQTAHFCLVAANCSLALFLSRRKAIEYLGQVNMLALTTILLLIPLWILHILIVLPPGFIIFYLAGTSLVVFMEYIRRMDYAGILLNDKWLAGANLVCIMIFLLVVLR